MRRSRLVLLLAGLAAGAVGVAAAQAPRPVAVDSVVRVYLDCRAFCDDDFLRTELTFVDWVRDREDSDVHLLVTTEGTGSGGRAYSLFLMGRRAFAGLGDTLVYHAAATDTQDERRRGLARMVRLGLVRYLARTRLASQLMVVVERAGPGAPAQPSGRDPWNNWVFTIGLDGNAFGESQTSSTRLSGRLTASRITDQWKTRLRLNGRRSTSSFELTDSTTLETVTEGYNASGLMVRSLGDHWSGGVEARAATSTIENLDLAATVSAGLEYSFFPYRESTRRLLTLQYRLELAHYDYTEETIFGKVQEVLANQALTLSLSSQQPWGSANGALEASTFLHDFSKNRFSIYGGVSVRVVKGLSVNLSGDYSRIRDQLSLQAGGLTDDEILLRLRQLATGYRYSLFFGVSYRFGSILNNVVNPRFDGGDRFFF